MKAAIVLIILIMVSIAPVFAQYQPHAIWSREGAGDSSLYGSQILALGDQNRGGFNDWAIYAHGWGGPGQTSEPMVEFFHGGTPPETEPYMVRLIQTPDEEYLWGARTLGDLNGDGYVDWAIIVELTADSLDRDTYKIYLGGPGAHEVPDLVLTAPWFSGYYPIGDFNGDGFDDLQLNEGVNNYAAIFYGGNPMDTIPDWIHYPTLVARGYGHLNGDRYSDFISDTGPVVGPQIFFGGEHPDTLPAYNFPTLHSGATSIVRDINGDGFDELCYSQRGYGGLSWGGNALHNSEDARLIFPCSGSGPLDIISAGDFNHDGFGDVVMLREWCEFNYGGVLTLHLGDLLPSANPAFVVLGWTEPFNLIHFKSAANLGDINGDHIDDLAIGANGGIETIAWRGKVVILGGDTTLVAGANEPHAALPEKLAVSVYPNPFNTSTTISFTLPKTEYVNLNVYDVTGRRVRALIGRTQGSPLQAGKHDIAFVGGELPSGIYFVRMEAGEVAQTRKMVLLK